MPAMAGTTILAFKKLSKTTFAGSQYGANVSK
jgi:hypothetical protein